MIWIVLALILLALAGMLALMSRDDTGQPEFEAEKRFNEVLETPDDAAWLSQRRLGRTASMTQRFKRLLERTPGTDMQEIEVLMRQAALVDEGTRARVYTSLWLAPLSLGAAGAGLALWQDSLVLQSAFGGLVIGFIGSRKLLRWLADRRRRAIRDEMPIVLNLMRLLFDAGLSLEHTLKAISEQARPIAPNLSAEFSWALTRIQHGQERGDALEDMARRLDVAELTETVAILKQAARHGGNLRDSLMRYIKLMEDRRLTTLRDKVGKMSAQMSLVMMVFMFPALMLYLGGPALISLGKALSGVGG